MRRNFSSSSPRNASRAAAWYSSGTAFHGCLAVSNYRRTHQQRSWPTPAGGMREMANRIG